MAVLNVQSNGLAPSNATVGDVIKTGGGNYQIVQPNTLGAKFNPNSGFWSVKLEDLAADSVQAYERMVANQQMSAYQNSLLSQDFAREQMKYQSEQNAKAMEFNRVEAEKNRTWQEYMSSTAHQREVKDLIAAGLNPVLSAMNGNGAAVTSGATASGVTSAGAQGDVDTSGSVAIGSLLSQLISRQTSLDIAKIQSAAAMYGADASANAVLGSASINAANQYAMMLKNNEFTEYLNRYYPQNLFGFGSALTMNLTDLLTRLFNGAKSAAQEDGTWLNNKLDWFKHLFTNPNK